MTRRTLALFSLVLCVPPGVAAAPPKKALPPADPRQVDYARDVKPILARACVGCHGPEKQRGGLRLDRRDDALAGGNSGAVLQAGNAAGSRHLQLVAGLDAENQMPPAGKAPLSAAEVGVLRAWVEQGLKWSKDDVAVSAGPKSNHWAFRAPKRPTPPAVAAGDWVRNDLDRFVLARLEKEKLRPSPEADRATLIRRLHLDLLGLPPTPAEVDAFVADNRPDAYERLVDRLLASPAYGERWARHWLDAGRYADSDGFEKDTGRPHAWRWRDWVIHALNADMPYDEFAVRQLAGDLLPGATVDDRVATGFHRNTLTNREGGVDQEQFRVEAVVDRVNTTARVFLGVTLGCCQCHDHKYDPFSQREYYQFFAFFNSDVETDVPAPTPAGEREYREKKAEHDRRRPELARAVDLGLKKWEAALTAADRGKLPPKVAAALAVDADRRTAAQRKLIIDHAGKTDPALLKQNAKLAAHDKAAPKPPLAQTLALGTPRPTRVMIRGDFLRPGVPVQAAAPAVLSPLKSTPDKATRLDLARWIADSSNPLTARVAVNWV